MWQRSQALALQIIQIVRKLPSDWGNAVVARQVIASATSVSANIAEGHARFTPNAHRNHLSIPKGSAAETDSWIDLLHHMGYLSEEEEQLLHKEYLWIMGALTGKILNLEQVNQRNKDQIGEVREDSYTLENNTDLEPVWPFVE